MSSNVLRRLTDKKGKQLSKFLGIDSAPSTQVIATMQSRINNPLFKLSIEDYEAMCENKMITKMMSKVIGCEEKQLKKFCKYINVFKENINSSPKSIKNKMKVTNSINASIRKGSLNVLPDDILDKIVKKYKTIFKIKYVLKDWISPEKLHWGWLSKNPNAIELLKTNPSEIDWPFLSANPNEEAIELLKTNRDEIFCEYLSLNTNPEAIELLKTKINEQNEMSEDELENLDVYDYINWQYLSKNPNAIELLKANKPKIDWPNLSRNINTEAIELLKKNPSKIDWGWLSLNSNDEAIELLMANQIKIDWHNLSANPNDRAIELLKENQKKIDWRYLSSNPNPNAIELLEDNKTKIDWEGLSLNPNAIELLKTYPNKINWYCLSKNPNAIELLKENQDNIDWKTFSENPAIFNEILE